jgi:carboxyl-terminal processing protease
VVIQDGGSASGAEVLAAALRDNNRATIVGVRSFGKGTVNQLQELHDCGDPEGCGALYLSVGRWYTPSGEQIEGIGVKPDIEVEMTGDDYIEHGDLQLYAAIDALRGN